jgi:hypothetical protein
MADDFVDRVLAAADTYEDDPDFGKRIGGMVEGTVTNNVDSLDMCRVKAKAAYCTEQGETDWLWPGLPNGIWTAPAVNTPIWIALWEGDPHHGMWFPWRRPDAYTAPTAFVAEADPSGILELSNAKVQMTGSTSIVMNAGTKGAAREDDDVEKLGVGTSMYDWMVQVETALNALAPGSVVPLSTTFSKLGEIKSSSSTVKIG